MNIASDLNLAAAVSVAGAMPSLMINWKKGTRTDFDYDLFNYTLQEFVKLTGNGHCVLQLDYPDLRDPIVIQLIEKYKISHVELFGHMQYPLDRKQEEFELVLNSYQEQYNRLKKTARIITRIFTPSNGKGIDCYALKGSDSAGCVGSLSVKDLFLAQHTLTPDIPLIAYGGIGTPSDVAWYLSQGVAGVAVGTLFAASKESCLSLETKQAMVNASSGSLTKLNTNQQALVMGTVSNDLNHKESLQAGIQGLGGLIYAGSSIDHVTDIRSVQSIVDYLVSDIINI